MPYPGHVAFSPDGRLMAQEMANELAWAHLTASEAVRDVEAAMPLAEKAVRLASAIANYRSTLAVAYCRARPFRRAERI
jgi:hypothetical protein